MARIGDIAHALRMLQRYVFDRPTRRSLKYRLPAGPVPSGNRHHYLCTATIVHNEAKYIAEFVAFHKLVGVDHMLIYDDRSTDNLQSALMHFLNEGFVEIIDWPRSQNGVNNQFAAYLHAVTLMSGKTTWLAMIDADEFLFAPASGNLKTELQSREHRSAVGVYSRTFGTGEVENIPDGGLVTEWLTKRGHSDNVKNRTQRTIVKPECVAAIRSANTCILKGIPFLGWDENDLPIHNTGEAGHTSECLRINHYFTRSKSDFQKKLKRQYFGKTGHGEKMQAKLSEEKDLSVEIDTEIQRYLGELRKLLRARIGLLLVQ
jgi:hypothetical protein